MEKKSHYILLQLVFIFARNSAWQLKVVIFTAIILYLHLSLYLTLPKLQNLHQLDKLTELKFFISLSLSSNYQTSDNEGWDSNRIFTDSLSSRGRS